MPRNFHWVIRGRLAVAQRIGGHGFQHRRVRREEEITWLGEEAGINTVVSLLEGNQNLSAYREAGFRVWHRPLVGEIGEEDVRLVFATIHEALSDPRAVVLVHRDLVDDTLAGVLAGYLMYAGMVEDPIMAVAVIQEILGRAVGPEGKRWVPEKAGR